MEWMLEEKPKNSEDLAQAVLLMKLEKPEFVDCNWEDDPLTLEQIECATIDAFVPYNLGRLIF